MPNPVVGMVGAQVGSSVIGASAQSKAAKSAAASQSAAAQAGIDEQRRQFDAVQELLRPFVETGSQAIQQQAVMLGLSPQTTDGRPSPVGVDGRAQPLTMQDVISQIQEGPEFTEMVRQGEEALLANAAATGGIRGGNTQSALAQFRPQVLNQLLSQRYQRLGGLAGLGQASASGQAAAAQNLGANVSSLLQQQGAAQAGASLARGQAFANAFGGIGQAAGTLFGAGMPSGGIPAGQGLFTKWGF